MGQGVLGRLLAKLYWEPPAAMKDFTEIVLCPEALDHSKVGLGGWGGGTEGSLLRAPHGATHAHSPADRVLQPRLRGRGAPGSAKHRVPSR